MHVSTRIKTVLLALGSLIAIAIASELALRVFGLGYGLSPHEGDPVLHHVHPRDYTFVTYSRDEEYPPHEVHYNAEGLVSDPAGGDSNPSPATYRLAFIGDSYLAAVEVPFRDSYFGLLKHRARAGVAMNNYGVSSYSPAIYQLQWDRQVAAFHPSHVFAMFCGNDIRNDEEYARAGVYSSDGTLLAVPDRGAGVLVRHLRQLYLARTIRRFEQIVRYRLRPKTDDATYVTGGYVEENPKITEFTSARTLDLVRKVEQSGAEFVLLVVPSRYRIQHPQESYDTPEYADSWRAWANEHGVRYLDLRPEFERRAAQGAFPFFEKDVHYNQVGHRIVADQIANSFATLFEPPTP